MADFAPNGKSVTVDRWLEDSLCSWEGDMRQSTMMITIACAMLTLFTNTPLVADTLNAEAVKGVLVGKIWVAKGLTGPAENYWEWEENGSLCLRVFKESGNCDDVGSWKLEADRVCYNLAWWGAYTGHASQCVRVSEPMTGHYETLDDNNVPMVEFTVLDR